MLQAIEERRQSGISGDMHEFAPGTRPEAREAIALSTYRIAGAVGRMMAALGGLDRLVFTAGFGKHAPDLPAEVCHRLAWLGVLVGADA